MVSYVELKFFATKHCSNLNLIKYLVLFIYIYKLAAEGASRLKSEKCLRHSVLAKGGSLVDKLRNI